MEPDLWPVEVVYAAAADHVIQKQLTVAPGATVGSIIQQSGILVAAPNIDLTQQAVGIFGQVVHLDDVAYANARIEIYRPLKMNPKDARWQRVKAQRSKNNTRSVVL